MAGTFSYIPTETQSTGFSGPVYNTYIVTVTGGKVYVGSPLLDPQLASNQAVAPLSAVVPVASARVFNFVYFVDGTVITQLNLVTLGMEAYAATTGTAPTKCGLACTWRGRLVLAGDSANPQNFYMSRSGVATDWDYSQTDPAAAVAGNLSTSGLIGEPITALIPYSDDIMLIGCTHSQWMLMGDPADGGTIVPISQNIGILGPNAWCRDSFDNLYFLGQGGLYKGQPMREQWQAPVLLTGETYNQYFQSLNASNQLLTMVWDEDNRYVHLYATLVDGNTVGTHLIYDTRNEGLWPIQFASYYHGPTAALLWYADATAIGRAILVGGWDGVIRKWSPTATDDDGSSFTSTLTFGPFKPFPEASTLSGATIDFGEMLPAENVVPNTWNADVMLASGPDAFYVTEGTPHTFVAINCPLTGRQKTFRQRLRGGWFSLTVGNSNANAVFSFESAVLEFSDAGRNRERR